MSKKAVFYTIIARKTNGITNYSVGDLLESINSQIFNEKKAINLVRKINEKYIRLFPFYHTINQKQIVIPFGKLKDKNKPYWLNSEDQLEEIPANLYDINSLGYDKEYNVMLFTTNREGPTAQNVEDYLNTFIPKNQGIYIKIEEIKYNTGLEKIRKANLVRSVTLNLDLGHSLNNFYLKEMDMNTSLGLIGAFQRLAETSRDEGNSKMLSLTLGLGKHGKKEDTLNLDSILQLLEQINIGADFVKEIQVTYKNGEHDKVDLAKLKQSQVFLYYNCRCDESQVSPQSLLNNINNAVSDKILVITKHIREYFGNNLQIFHNTFDIVAKWNNDV